MTIIAFDGRYFVADSAAFRGDMRLPWPLKKIVAHEGVVFSQTGYDEEFQAMMEWYLAGRNRADMPPALPDQRCSVLIAIRRGEKIATHYVTGGGGSNMSEPPWAWGVAGELAIGAMRGGGLNAISAAEACCKLNVWCGGPLQVFDLERWKFLSD